MQGFCLLCARKSPVVQGCVCARFLCVAFFGFSLAFLWFSLVFLWFFFGFSLAFLWLFFGFSVCVRKRLNFFFFCVCVCVGATVEKEITNLNS